MSASQQPDREGLDRMLGFLTDGTAGLDAVAIVTAALNLLDDDVGSVAALATVLGAMREPLGAIDAARSTAMVVATASIAAAAIDALAAGTEKPPEAALQAMALRYATRLEGLA